MLRPALLVLVLFVVLRSAGFGSAAGALLAAPWVATCLVLLRRDPWLAHRLLTWLPEALALLGFSLIGVCRALERRRLLWAGDTRLVVAVAAAAFVLRAGILNHPDYWYPDLHSHARLVEIVREARLGFLPTAGQVHLGARASGSSRPTASSLPCPTAPLSTCLSPCSRSTARTW